MSDFYLRQRLIKELTHYAAKQKLDYSLASPVDTLCFHTRSFMKSFLFVTAFLLSTFATAAEAKKEETRKPASLESELVQSYIRTADLLSQARIQSQTCEMEAYQTTIIGILSNVKDKESFSPNMITPNIRKALAGTIFLKELTGEAKLDYDSTDANYQKALLDSYFESPAVGAYGPSETFVLKAGGVVEVTNMLVLNEEPWFKTTVSKGTWGVKSRPEKYDKIVRVWLTVNGKTRAYRIERSYTNGGGWILQTKPKNDNSEQHLRIKFYNGYNSECEA